MWGAVSEQGAAGEPGGGPALGFQAQLLSAPGAPFATRWITGLLLTLWKVRYDSIRGKIVTIRWITGLLLTL